MKTLSRFFHSPQTTLAMEGKQMLLHDLNRDLVVEFLSLKPSSVSKFPNVASCDLSQLLVAFGTLCELSDSGHQKVRRSLSLVASAKVRFLFPDIYTALDLWANGAPGIARKFLVEHLTKNPMDVGAIHMLHMFDFLHGNPEGYRDYCDLDFELDDDWLKGYLLGIQAFCHSELGALDKANIYAREALQINPSDIYAVHALVHSLHDKGRHSDIVDFLTKSQREWADNMGMNMHVFWHMSISYLYLLDIGNGVEYFDRLVELKGDTSELKDMDTSNFLFRLFWLDDSHSALSYFKQLSINWAPSIYDSLSYFNDLHAAMSFVGANQQSLLRKLVDKPEIESLCSETNRVGKAIISAFLDYMQSDHETCVYKLQSTKDRWHLIGGSIAQREVLDLMLIVSSRASGITNLEVESTLFAQRETPYLAQVFA